MRLTRPRSEADFERNVLGHLDAAYNLARWLLGDAHDAEDVVQESAIRAYASYKGFRGSDAKAWFLAIVRNGCMNRLRRSPSHLSLHAADAEGRAADGEPSPAELAVKAWEADTIRSAIDGLAIEHREIIILRELEGLSYKEIATVTELPIGTVMSRLARARSRLQKDLAHLEGDAP